MHFHVSCAENSIYSHNIYDVLHHELYFRNDAKILY